MDKVKVLFLFHMHQPMYRLRKDGKNVYIMPWIYLHGIREYYDVARVIDDIDDIKITINFTPTLIEQLEDYIKGDVDDIFLNHFKKPQGALDLEDKVFILENFFSINYHSKLRHSKRYLYLLDKRGSPYDLEKKVRTFTDSEIQDLVVLFYLYNTSVYAQREYPELRELIKKDYGFTEDDKKVLLDIHKRILQDVIPLYKRLQEEGKIEITFTPYAHPISPLLLNSKCAEVSNPYTRLPDKVWSFPENVKRQLSLGMEYIESTFGKRPEGMWPAEGGVSEEFIELAARQGVKWVATDEGILEKSLGYVIRNAHVPSEIYKMYEFNGVRVFFRDRELSDMLGFTLYKTDVNRAVSIFMDKIRSIANTNASILSIILDGENPWENYEEGGVPFLKKLFNSMHASGLVEFVTGKDLLSSKSTKLNRLHPGSWIRSDFTTWIGHPEKNKAWEYLIRVKNDVKDKLKPGSREEMELIYAEGSDWFWWYGDDNPTFYARSFDMLYREHLKAIYRELSLPVPGFLDVPIKVEGEKNYVIENESDFITPTIDGKITNFFEWLGAGVIDLQKGHGGVMQKSTPTLTKLFYGRDRDNLYIRVEGKKSIEHIDKSLGIEFFDEEGRKILEIVEKAYEHCVRLKVVECSIPLKKVLQKENKVMVAIKLVLNDVVEERYPQDGYYTLRLIKEEDIENNWMV